MLFITPVIRVDMPMFLSKTRVNRVSPSILRHLYQSQCSPACSFTKASALCSVSYESKCSPARYLIKASAFFLTLLSKPVLSCSVSYQSVCSLACSLTKGSAPLLAFLLALLPKPVLSCSLPYKRTVLPFSLLWEMFNWTSKNAETYSNFIGNRFGYCKKQQISHSFYSHF